MLRVGGCVVGVCWATKDVSILLPISGTRGA